MVSAQETSLQVILEGTKQYQVPLYQRTYSWTRKQLQRLWTDLEMLAEDRRHNPKATHFIGSLVLAPSPANGPAGVSRYLVVDGQQRLTTLTILLAAIRDHHREHLPEAQASMRFEQINETFLINKFENGLSRHKLLPTQGDRSSYDAIIKRTAQAGGNDTVGRAYVFFRERLIAADDPDDPHDIVRLQEAALGGLSLVSVTTHESDNVHRIFESLNNTGLQLSQGDLLRNYLFMRMPERAETVYSTVWRPLEETLGTENLEMLFWLDLAQSDDRAKMTDIYTAQVARLDRLTSEDEFEREVRRFARLGDLLRLILDPALESDPHVRLRLQHLKDWDTTTVRPALLLLLQRRADGEATSQQIAAAMLYIESFLIRRLLLGKATNANNRILARAAIEIGQGQEVDTAVHRYLSSGRKYYGTDEEVRDAVASIPFYLNGRPLQRKLVLKWLEDSFGSQEPVDVAQATIEHVLPQTSSESWIAALQTDLRDDEDVEEVYQELLHTIGNLTLTGYNGTLGNRTFAQKRAELSRSGIRLSESITSCDRWSRPEILHRAEQLADRIIRVWPGPTSDVTPVGIEAKWQHLRRAVAAIPAGYWTSYSDIATLIGSSAQPVGAYLAAASDLSTAHRVLKTGGYLSPGFRWHEATRTDDLVDVLTAEGLTFDGQGTADPRRRLTAEQLAEALGETIAEDPDPEDADAA